MYFSTFEVVLPANDWLISVNNQNFSSRQQFFPVQFAEISDQGASIHDQGASFYDQGASRPVKNHFDRAVSRFDPVKSRFYMKFSALIGLNGKMFWFLPV